MGPMERTTTCKVQPMIIELFGPPAAGKTTLAHALARALEKQGFDVQLMASSRPAECDSVQIERNRALSWYRTAVGAPLSRAAKLVSAAPALLAGARSDELTASLMELLPSRTVWWSVRFRRFLFLLSRSWTKASTSDRIVIFDQGFITLLCSMALRARSADRSVLARGLALIPRPHLLVRLDAPRETLQARLGARLDRQGAIERRFEFDLQTSLEQIGMTSEVAHMLQQQGVHMMYVSSLDHRLLETTVDRIVREIKLARINSANRSLAERRSIVRVTK
jgi:thymidylate kinase